MVKIPDPPHPAKDKVEAHQGERLSEKIMREAAEKRPDVFSRKSFATPLRPVSAGITELFTQYRDQLVRVTFVSGEGISQGIGYLRREVGGFWDLACDAEVSGAVLSSTAIRCDLICQVEAMDRNAIIQLQLDARNAAIKGTGGMPIADEPRRGEA